MGVVANNIWTKFDNTAVLSYYLTCSHHMKQRHYTIYLNLNES